MRLYLNVKWIQKLAFLRLGTSIFRLGPSDFVVPVIEEENVNLEYVKIVQILIVMVIITTCQESERTLDISIDISTIQNLHLHRTILLLMVFNFGEKKRNPQFA